MQKLSASISDFEKLRLDGYRYVDKTEHLWNLIMPAGESYFLSRPRRFGKSLALSTLKAIFQGKRDLFEGLAIAQKDYDWKPYPIIHLDLSIYSAPTCGTPEKLNGFLIRRVEACAQLHGITLPHHEQAGEAFDSLIVEMSRTERVVILVDEYDKPILDNLSSPELPKLQETLRSFYSPIKANNALERFVLVTGVSKFCHVSLFSDLNNLTDLTMAPETATLFGYTQGEIEANFGDRLDDACRQLKITRQELLGSIRNWYDGYQFAKAAERVYNPVSLTLFLTRHYEFGDYWFDTGTPHFLVKTMSEKNFDLEGALARPLRDLDFKAFDAGNIDPLALLVQTGYLTIRRTEPSDSGTLYYLGFPNHEVCRAFNFYLLNAYTTIREDTIRGFLRRMASRLRSHDPDGFMEAMRSLLAAIPYDIHLRHEKYYQTVFYVTFLLLGTSVQAEARTSTGRIDALVQTPGRVYIFEFKLDKSPQDALDQIRDRDYFRQFAGAGRPVTLVGANFDGETRQLGDWLVQQA